jgi:deoxyribodipyrimidine photo-lyase
MRRALVLFTVPELDAVPGRDVHEPWRLPAVERRALRYPRPIVAIHGRKRG